jgi:hypothetical protein|tara:strand:- start:7565 stop:8260 length:696 start_codon:yes stop_codon:yes gene_type:complete
MATIPNSQKFHTLAGTVETENRGSAALNAQRTIYTMQDILDTVTVGGGVDGSGTAGKISKWIDANTVGDSIMAETTGLITVTGGLTATADINSANVTASAAVAAVSLEASGNVTGVNMTASGNMAAVDMAASGNMTAVNVTGSGVVGGNSLTSASTLSVSGAVTGVTNLTMNGILSSASSVVSEAFSVAAMQTAPASATATGVAGAIVFASDALYVCVATNTWKKAVISTF